MRIGSSGRAIDLTNGSINSGLVRFAMPMILGNLLQQVYNITDSVIVGKCIGPQALAAVGSTYTLMTFLTSILIGLCMGSGTLYAISHNANDRERLKSEIVHSAYFISGITVILYLLLIPGLKFILKLLQIPTEIDSMMSEYVQIVLIGMVFTVVYNFFAYLLRALGDSFTPLAVVGAASAINIVLDLVMILVFHTGIAGAAWATVIAQCFSSVYITVYTVRKHFDLMPGKAQLKIDHGLLKSIAANDIPTCFQQSIMNFGILMIQGLVNSFGTAIMAAFTAAVKVDTLAYMPSQEFGNAYSIFISSNLGAKKDERIRRGTKNAFAISITLCIVISLIVFLLAGTFMTAFVDPSETEIIAAGVRYLHIEGSCYIGIGCLFLFYGCYRGLKRPKISLLLTVISLGTRVLLAYTFAPMLGVSAIWWAIPIGWFLADMTGAAILYKTWK